MSNEEINLYPEHIEDLKKSGLNEKTIGLMGVYSVKPDDISKALGWSPKEVNSVLAFPYLNKDGFERYKVFPSYRDDDGQRVKYLQKKGTGSHLYIFPPVNDVLRNPNVPLAIAEGEKKTASLVQAGVMAIGVGGIWNWVDGVGHKPIHDFDQIAWVDRKVFLYFDSDVWHRPLLLKPLYALGKELEGRGALVQIVVIDQTGQDKSGIDDFIVANGEQALADLKKIDLKHKTFSEPSEWWKGWKGKRVKNDLISDKDYPDLKSAIQAIRKTPLNELRAFEKKQQIASGTLTYFRANGALHVTPEGHGYYFDQNSGLLNPLQSDAFNRFLSDITGLNPTETEFKYLTEQIQTETRIHGKKTRVFSLAHYNQVDHKLYISNFKGGMLILDGESVTVAPNGKDGVLFVSSPMAVPYQYLSLNERIEESTVDDFIKPINCDPHLSISPDEVRQLISAWLLSMFFPELHPTKVIPTFIGPQGATKTTTARRIGILMMGERFNVGHLEAADRGEQAFIATVCGKPFAAFDNADAPIKWLSDRLATFATGHEFELRELYTTNQLGIYKPMANIVLTSRDPHFRRPDVAERLLIVKLIRPQTFIPESEVVQDLMRRRDSVWSDLLDTLNWTLKALRDVSEAPRMGFRMADFASFGWRLSKARGGDQAANGFQESLKKMEKEQASYTTEEDPVSMCLGVWLENGSNYDVEIDTGKLYIELVKIANTEGLLLPKTAAVLGKRLRQARKAIELSLDIKIAGTQTTHTSRWRFIRASA